MENFNINSKMGITSLFLCKTIIYIIKFLQHIFYSRDKLSKAARPGRCRYNS